VIPRRIATAKPEPGKDAVLIQTLQETKLPDERPDGIGSYPGIGFCPKAMEITTKTEKLTAMTSPTALTQ